MKLLVLLMDPVWMIVIAFLVIYIVALRRRMAALHDPILMLSRKERRQWARKELSTRDEEAELARFKRNMDIVQGKDAE